MQTETTVITVGGYWWLQLQRSTIIATSVFAFLRHLWLLGCSVEWGVVLPATHHMLHAIKTRTFNHWVTSKFPLSCLKPGFSAILHALVLCALSSKGSCTTLHYMSKPGGKDRLCLVLKNCSCFLKCLSHSLRCHSQATLNLVISSNNLPG